MLLGFHQFIFCFYLIGMARRTDGITLTVTPSNDVEVNQSVTLLCHLDSEPDPPLVAIFYMQPPQSLLCALESSNGVCKNTTDPCRTLYNASCPSDTRYSIQVTVPSNWNNVSVVCQTLDEHRSNRVLFSVRVPVTSVALTPTSITVTDGQLINLTCTTSASNPQANITWYKSSMDITNDATLTTRDGGGLARTISLLQSRVVKEDNGKRVHCIASNTLNQFVTSNVQSLNVLYKPEVSSSLSSLYSVKEGETATLNCAVTDANPYTGITWRWFKTDSPNAVFQSGPTFTIPNIQKGKTGSYSCTGRNAVGASEAVTIVVDVQFGPGIQMQAVMIVNETQKAVLTGKISSNPLSNVSWYDGSHMLKFESAVNITYLIIEEAKCTDTRNFTLTASNTVRVNVTSSVQLIVNCKPVSDVNNISLEVTDITGIVFSTTVIAYPKPQYALLFENGRKTRDILDNIEVNAINNFTIHFNKKMIQLDDFGFYRLFINNTFGETVIYVAVLPQRTPDSPRMVEITCSVKTAKIQWRSSFNGGVTQTFKALVIFKQRLVSQSQIINDYGENVIHNTQLTNLQPSTKYAFYIVAQNKCGNSSSERRECITLEEPRNQASLIAGSTIGSLGLVIFILVAVYFFHRRYTCNIRDERRKGSTNIKDNEESYYTTMTEHENTERNVYDELDNSHSQYESVLAKDREEDENKMYEKLQKLETGNEIHLYDQTNVHLAEGSTKPLHGLSTQGSTCEYMNTSFTQ